MRETIVRLACDEEVDFRPGGVTVMGGGRPGPLLSQYFDLNSVCALTYAQAQKQTDFTGISLAAATLKPPHKGIMKTALDDIKNFIHEHRTAIYMVAAILLIDHFFLGGKLTARIKAMCEKLLGAAEKKIHDATEPKPTALPTP